VTLPPGRARLSTRPAATGSEAAGNTMGMVRVSCNNGPTVEMRSQQWRPCERHQFGRIFGSVVGIAFRPASVDPNVATDHPAQLLQLLQSATDASLIFRIIRGCSLDDADPPHALSLLRACNERPTRPPRRRASLRIFVVRGSFAMWTLRFNSLLQEVPMKWALSRYAMLSRIAHVIIENFRPVSKTRTAGARHD